MRARASSALGLPDPIHALTTLDRAAYRFGRDAYDRFRRRQAAEATLWLLVGERIAYSYADRKGLIGPLAGRDGEAAALALLLAPLAVRDSRKPRQRTVANSRAQAENASRRYGFAGAGSQTVSGKPEPQEVVMPREARRTCRG